MPVNANEAVALLPCPFCGSEDVSESIGRHADGSAWRYIECGYCASTAEPLIWNRRASTARVPDGFVLVPKDALDWLFGEAGIFECPPSSYFRGKPPAYWWRSEFRKRIAAATMSPEPPK